MHVLPAKHSSWSVTDGQTDGRTDRRTDRRRTKWSLCVAMLRRRHKKEKDVFLKHRCRPWQQSPIKAKIISKSYILTPPPLSCDVSEVWATLVWTSSQSLVYICLSKIKILHISIYSWKSYCPGTSFGYMDTVTLTLEIWLWVKIMTHPQVMYNNYVNCHSNSTYQLKNMAQILISALNAPSLWLWRYDFGSRTTIVWSITMYKR